MKCRSLMALLIPCLLIPTLAFQGTQAIAQVRLLGISGNQENDNQVDFPDATLFEISLTDATLTQIQRLTFLPDTDTMGFNPNDGLIYHTAGSESWTNDNGRTNGFRDHQYMETVNLETGELTPIFNANPCPSPDSLPCFGLAAPRPDWLLPKEVRLFEQTGDEFRERGENEYHALRALTWSTSENLFYAADERGVFTLTTDGESTFIGQPIETEPKALAFAKLDGETKLLMGEKAGGNLWEIDPATGEAIDDPVELFFTDTGDTLKGLLALAQHPETGVLYGIHKSDNPFDRELITIDAVSGETELIGFVEIHLAGLAFVSAPQLIGDCSGNGVLDAADLACVATIDERDAVLGALSTLPGDLDGVGGVAFSDFLKLAENFGKEPASYSEGNVDLAGGVEFADFLALAENFGKVPVAVAAVPEPSGMVLLGFGGLWLALIQLIRPGLNRGSAS